MGYNLRSVQHLSEKQMLEHLNVAARKYNRFVNTDVMFVYKKTKTTDIDYYEIFFGKRNFMHLAGVRSKNLNPEQFYDACLYGTIKKDDCNPTHSVNNMHSKISVLYKMFDFEFSKIYKIGEKDLITRNNDFEVAIGNEIGIVGYDSRINVHENNNINKNRYAIPTTLLDNPISSYCSESNKILYVFQKNREDKLYNKLHYEIKKGLLNSQNNNLSQEIMDMINIPNSQK